MKTNLCCSEKVRKLLMKQKMDENDIIDRFFTVT